MIISKSKLILDKTIPIQKEFLFEKKHFNFVSPFLSIKKCYGNVEITKYRNFIRINADLQVIAVLECSYTLKPFNHELLIHEEVLISDKYEDEDEAIIIPGDDIELEQILFALISSDLPIKPIKPGAELPKSGDGYRIIDDAQLLKERSQSGDSRFAKLDEIDFDDEDN
ncbi:MAG: hypothetical protein WCX85_00465 [Bacilli bacterium]|jgi:uncharacterized metal-binding protein YceD (DUF177 family)|nr:hypothetical protein [Bacilli bacterium]